MFFWHDRRELPSGYLERCFTDSRDGVSEAPFSALNLGLHVGDDEGAVRANRARVASELGGVPIATMVAQLTGLPALFVRKKAKEYGTCKLAEGQDVAGRRVTLVEDVITTGGAVRDAVRELRAAGAVVEVVICAIDRSPAGENPLADVALEVRPVLTKAQLDDARSQAG